MKVGRKILFARELYDVPGTLQIHFREHYDSFNKIVVIIFRFLKLNIFGVLGESNKIMTQFLHNIPGPTYAFTTLSGGNQVDGLPPAFI